MCVCARSSNVYCRGVLVASADLEAGHAVELWADLDDCRTLKPKRVKGAPKGSSKGDKAAVAAGSERLGRGPNVLPKTALSAVLHGSALQSYRGRRLKLGVGVAAMARGAMMRAPGGLAVTLTALAPGVPAAPSLNGVLSPRYYAQNLPSAVCAHVLDPKPGMRVIDMCAAPGGKVKREPRPFRRGDDPPSLPSCLVLAL
jgi:hypothetical protein